MDDRTSVESTRPRRSGTGDAELAVTLLPRRGPFAGLRVVPLGTMLRIELTTLLRRSEPHAETVTGQMSLT